MTQKPNSAIAYLAIALALTVLWIPLCVVSFKAVSAMGIDQAGATFIGDLSHPWRAQFNVDFGIHLMLVAGWLILRARNAVLGVLWAVCAVVGGGMFTLPYLAIAILRAQGCLTTVLLGRQVNSTNRS